MSGEITIRKIDGEYEVECPYCGAHYRVPEHASYGTCPYCGTTIALAKRTIEEKHYIFRVYIDSNKAYRLATKFASQQWNSPGDLADKAVYETAKLHYIPIYVYNISYRIQTEDPKIKHLVEEMETILERYVAEIALSKPVIPIHPRYGFPVRGRDRFKPFKRKKNLVFHRPDRDPYKILVELKKIYYKEAQSLAQSLGGPVEIEDNSSFIGVAHYPFWEIVYRKDGNRYRAYVDAADGTIVYVEYPLSFTGRVLSFTASAAIFVGTAALGLGIGLLLHHTVIGLIGGVLAGAPAYRTLFSSSKEKIGKYIYNPEEEGFFAPVR